MMRRLVLIVTCACVAGCKFFTFAFDQADCTNVAGWHFWYLDSQANPVLGSDMPADKMGGCGGQKTNAVDIECQSGVAVATWMTAYDTNGVESAASNVVEVICP